MFNVATHEEPRYKRIRELLLAFDMFTEARASVMLDLTDEDTPSDFSALARRGGFRLADAMRTEQLMRRLSTRLGRPGGKVDREQRDYAIAPLRELGVVEKAYVLPRKEWPKTGDDLIVIGKHFSKSGNNAYRVTDEVRSLMQASDEDWSVGLEAFVMGDARRRVRLLQKQAVATLGTSVGTDRHKALIRATRVPREVGEFGGLSACFWLGCVVLGRQKSKWCRHTSLAVGLVLAGRLQMLVWVAVSGSRDGAGDNFVARPKPWRRAKPCSRATAGIDPRGTRR